MSRVERKKQAIDSENRAAEEQKAATELSEREQKIREMILQNRRISVDQIAEEFAVDRRTILRDVSKMKSKIKIAFDKKTSMWTIE